MLVASSRSRSVDRRTFLSPACSSVVARDRAPSGAQADQVKLPPLEATSEKPKQPEPAAEPPDKQLDVAVVGIGHLTLEQLLPAFAQSRSSRLAGPGSAAITRKRRRSPRRPASSPGGSSIMPGSIGSRTIRRSRRFTSRCPTACTPSTWCAPRPRASTCCARSRSRPAPPTPRRRRDDAETTLDARRLQVRQSHADDQLSQSSTSRTIASCCRPCGTSVWPDHSDRRPQWPEHGRSEAGAAREGGGRRRAGRRRDLLPQHLPVHARRGAGVAVGREVRHHARRYAVQATRGSRRSMRTSCSSSGSRAARWAAGHQLLARNAATVIAACAT